MKNELNVLCTFLLCALLTTSCTASSKLNSNSPLAGKWLLELNSSDIGLANMLITFDADSASFTAYTRENADRMILGWGTSTMARLFTKNFKNGSLIRIVNGKIKNSGDSMILSGVLTSAMGNFYFDGSVYNKELNAQLSNGKREKRGTIKGIKGEQKVPLTDYVSLTNKTFELTGKHIYKGDIVKEKEFEKFKSKIESAAPEIQDDLEMLFLFFYHAGKLPFSHYSLVKMPSEEPEESTSALKGQIALVEKSPNTAYMKIHSFGGTGKEVDSTFELIREKGYKNLIVDLRDNTGGSVAAGMEFATNVADSSFYGGVFLTQKWFAKHSGPPQVSEYASLDHFSESNFDLIIEGIHNKEGLCLKVIPQEAPYTGNLYILTNGSTASTCEPIVYGLKQYGRATVIGEKTAGAMLNGEFFEVADGWSVVIPTADYYAADGYRIDQKGVEPNIETESAGALDYVMQNLIKE